MACQTTTKQVGLREEEKKENCWNLAEKGKETTSKGKIRKNQSTQRMKNDSTDVMCWADKGQKEQID